MSDSQTKTKSICLLSLSPIADDPRVRRQGDAFFAAGWQVTGVGIGDSRSSAPEWPIIRADPVAAAVAETSSITSESDKNTHIETTTGRTKLEELRLKLPIGLRVTLRPVVRLMYTVLRYAKVVTYLAKSGVHLLRWTISVLRRAASTLLEKIRSAKKIRKDNDSIVEVDQYAGDSTRAEADYLSTPTIGKMYDAARHVRADFYLANDWHMLPVARKLASEHAGQFGYDTHEYALEEYKYRDDWRFKIPIVAAIEGAGLRDASVTTAVSAGIAKDMARVYRLARTPIEIRNVPSRRHVTIKPCSRRIAVYFHGIITFDRGLEACIRSVPLWRPEFVFQMRGPIRPEFEATLRATIIETRTWSRVEFLPEVPMTDLVDAANAADIGISTPPRTSKHNIYALPNKFFEYIQAGLALCISDLPDMSAILREYDLGVLIEDLSPEAIAKAINSFDRESVDTYKQNSKLAAEVLNWEVEQTRLVELYEGAYNSKKRQI